MSVPAAPRPPYRRSPNSIAVLCTVITILVLLGLVRLCGSTAENSPSAPSAPPSVPAENYSDGTKGGGSGTEPDGAGTGDS